MYIFFQCVAEAVAENGLRGLAEFIPGGGAMYDIAESTWKKYRERCKDAQQRDEIQKLAQASFEDAKQAAIATAKKAAKQPEIQAVLELYLTQIPASIRQSLKRKDDPTGTTVPRMFALRSADDVAKLLPSALPRFRPGDALPGRNGWVLDRQLGIGGFGEVWLARHPQYQSLVRAVKFCRNLDTRDRDLLHESKVIDQLLKEGPHDHIVQLLDVNLEGNAPWLMYEYVEGGDLTDLIHEWAGLAASERQEKAIAALKELAATIGHFHALNPAIVHRDLKPANILRDKKGRLRITDFGISGIAARHMIENETRGVTTLAGRRQFTHSGSYTPMYAPPQQRDGGEPDPRDDVHALGVIAYQMLTGQIISGVSSDFAEDLREAGVQQKLIELLGQCTAAKAERRPESAADVVNAIAKIEKNRTDPLKPAVARSHIKCESCGSVLKLKEPILVGKKVKCPKCASVIVVKDEEDYDEPQENPRRQVPKIEDDDDLEIRSEQTPSAKGPSRITCAVFAILLGGWGIHKFMSGRSSAGVIHILSNFVCLGAILGWVEGIIYLTKTDEEFHQTYVVEKKGWF